MALTVSSFFRTYINPSRRLTKQFILQKIIWLIGGSGKAIKIAKSIYDTVIKRMMSGAPEIMEDKDAQEVMATLNPYT